jgi:hypothetical protein
MKIAILVAKLLLLLFLGHLLSFLLLEYHPELPQYHPPFVIFVLDTVNLFIHEAGHFFFKPFGEWIHVLAGSFFQILLPLVLAFVTWRQKPEQVPLPAFWAGESFVNVSVYIRDAPHMQLKLLAKGLIHDWNWLLNGHLGAAEPLGELVFWLGILLCAGSLALGLYLAVQSFRRPETLSEG